MRLPQPLRRGRLVRRYKRFLADVVFDDGGEETVHAHNPGAMLGLADPGLTVWTSCGGSATRKLPHTLELVETASGALVGVNTLHPNRLVTEALAEGRVPELAGYAAIRREVRYGEKSRVDFLLESPDRPPCWVEVKGVTLSSQLGLAEWPDCVSARGTRHLGELVERVRTGDRAVVLFVAQRSDCDRFAIAADLDPAFAAARDCAAAAGVEALAYACDVSLQAITITTRIEVQDSGASVRGSAG